MDVYAASAIDTGLNEAVAFSGFRPFVLLSLGHVGRFGLDSTVAGLCGVKSELLKARSQVQEPAYSPKAPRILHR